MEKIKSSRIESIDILRGLAMVIMALDHVRDYFHFGSFFVDPTELETTTPFVFFTRFITHNCAPAFIFLAGTSAFLYGSKKTKKELSRFLWTRGVWLIFLEVAVNNLIWTFNITYSLLIFQVIWAIGVSMIVLSLLIYLPKKVLLITGFVLVAGHNLLDPITFEGDSFGSILWYILHQRARLQLTPDFLVLIGYPVIPWIGLMVLGYCFGTLYKRDFDPKRRRKLLLGMGFGAIALFYVLRGINVYGDLHPWSEQRNFLYTMLSFFNVTKYPPSIVYLLITIGPALLFLAVIEPVKNRVTNFLLVFGRVPLFYYFLHMIVIHSLAVLGMVITGGDWHKMIFTGSNFLKAPLLDYGYPLWVVYVIWMAVVLLLYPFCKKYMIYKSKNKDKWWLSYL
ncbi:MAG: DUF1624 domain-containing protein [Bacteroidales bacterium]|nr:DUF1624 domain-containing protein [Bacteroidales bacterium]